MAGDIKGMIHGFWPNLWGFEVASPPPPPPEEPVRCVVEWKHSWEVSESGRAEEDG